MNSELVFNPIKGVCYSGKFGNLKIKHDRLTSITTFILKKWSTRYILIRGENNILQNNLKSGPQNNTFNFINRI